MKITQRQLRRIIREALADSMDSQDLYVVIGNAGRGRQNLWPSSDDPEAYSKEEAEKIAQDLNDKQGRGYMQVHYHVKSIDDAMEYIESGRPRAGLFKLTDDIGEYRR